MAKTKRLSKKKQAELAEANMLNSVTEQLKVFAQLYVTPIIRAIKDPLGDRVKQAEGIEHATDTGLDHKESLELIFGVMYRDLIDAVVVEDVKLMGLVWGRSGLLDAVPIGVLLTKGTELIVRIDERMPNRVDVEDVAAEKMYTLTKFEYEQIFTKLKDMRRWNNLRLVPPTTFMD